MTVPFDLLPTELQASVVELRQAGVPEPIIATTVERMVTALGIPANRAQVDVWQIGQDIRAQLAQIGNKLQSDIQTQLGATNEMLIDLRATQMNQQPVIEEAGRGIADIKKNWQELDSWRSRVEATLASFAESRQVSVGKHAQTQTRLSSIEARLIAIEQLLEIAGNHEAGGG